MALIKSYHCGGETLGTVVKHSVRDSKMCKHKSCVHANKCKWSAYINGHFLLVFLLGAHFLIGTFSTPDRANSHFFMLLVALLYSLVIFFSLSTFLQSIPVDSWSGQLPVVLCCQLPYLYSLFISFSKYFFKSGQLPVPYVVGSLLNK